LDDVSSKRRNPILADVFAQLNFMEKRGSGLRKICNETSKLPGFTEAIEPRFRSQSTSFYTELPNKMFILFFDTALFFSNDTSRYRKKCKRE
jgi:ATP-dependent DNA helicase RecG